MLSILNLFEREYKNFNVEELDGKPADDEVAKNRKGKPKM